MLTSDGSWHGQGGDSAARIEAFVFKPVIFTGRVEGDVEVAIVFLRTRKTLEVQFAVECQEVRFRLVIGHWIHPCNEALEVGSAADQCFFPLSESLFSGPLVTFIHFHVNVSTSLPSILSLR